MKTNNKGFFDLNERFNNKPIENIIEMCLKFDYNDRISI